jgi:hypothetical protein
VKVCIYHPGRKVKAHGMCATCYREDLRGRVERGEHVPKPHVPNDQPCECGAKAGVSGKCIRCYQREYKRFRRAGGQVTRPVAKSRYGMLLAKHLELKQELALLTALLWGE